MRVDLVSFLLTWNKFAPKDNVKMIELKLHKKWSFPLRIFSVNVTKSQEAFFCNVSCVNIGFAQKYQKQENKKKRHYKAIKMDITKTILNSLKCNSYSKVWGQFKRCSSIFTAHPLAFSNSVTFQITITLDMRHPLRIIFSLLRYVNFELSFKLRWCGARDLFGS